MPFESKVASLERQGDVALLTVDNPPVNALGRDVRQCLVDAIREVAQDDTVKALVVICAGKTFFAGADIREFGLPPTEPFLPDAVAAIEDSPKPVIAAIHGTALGGGLEVALGCHYRIAAPSARMGLPEVNLGLMPGAGGTQRLPRLIGMAKALEIIATGAPIAAGEARDLGLIDALSSGDLKQDAIAFAQSVSGSMPLRTRDKAVGDAPDTLFDSFAEKNRKKFNRLDAPAAIIDTMQRTRSLSFDEGMKIEREAFLRLREGSQSKALRHAFFAERESAKVADITRDTPRRTIATVGVVGAGTMGTGIALAFLAAGFPVSLLDAQPEALQRGVDRINTTIDRNVASGRTNAKKAEQQRANLKPVSDFAALGECDLIVEAAFETMEVKRDVFTKLDRHAKAGAILATNTSYLDVDEIAAATSRPQDVVGLHFFSPANIMKLLEIVRAAKTSTETLATSIDLAQRIGKIPVVAGNAFGFIGNRLLAVRRTVADQLILQGASPYEVDATAEAFGFPMGPFRISDLAGLDLGWSAEKSTSSTIRECLCEIGRRGQKTNSGFYDYADGKAAPSAMVEELIRTFAEKHGYKQRSFTREEILDHLLYPMFNEAAAILSDGIATRASDIDVVWLHGYGWPRWTGGPAFMADEIGLPKVVSRLDELGYGERITPLLRTLANAGKGLKDYQREK